MKYQVSINASVLQAMLDLKGDQPCLQNWLRSWPELADLVFPDVKNTAGKCNDTATYWIGQSHWLVRAPLEREAALASIARAAETLTDVSAIVVSDAMAFYRIQGPDADQIISIASPLDIHDSVFPFNGVTYTEFFGLKALIIRCNDGFEIGTDRSYFDMMGDCFAHTVGRSDL